MPLVFFFLHLYDDELFENRNVSVEIVEWRGDWILFNISVCTCNIVYSVIHCYGFLQKVSISNLVACLLSKKKSNQRLTIVIRIKQVLSAKEDRKDLLCITFERMRNYNFNISFISTWNSFFLAPNLFFELFLCFPN